MCISKSFYGMRQSLDSLLAASVVVRSVAIMRVLLHHRMNHFVRTAHFATICVGAYFFSCPAFSSGAVVMSFTQQSDPFNVSTTDLLNGVLPQSITGVYDEEGLGSDGSGVCLTNGTFGDVGLSGDNSQLSIFHDGGSVTYLTPTRIDIYQIATYSGWRDDGRSQQDYEVSVSSDGGLNWTLLLSVGTNQGDLNQQVIIYDDAGYFPIATNIDAIKFEFPVTQNGYVGYREFDVFGTTSYAVPEPTSMAIFTIGALGMAYRARRKRNR